MEQHVRKQQANVATEPENNNKPEGEKLPPDAQASTASVLDGVKSPSTEQANIRSMADIVNAIKEGDNDIEQALKQFVKKINGFSDTLTDIQIRIANIETCTEAQQLSNVTILDKLAKVGMAFVTFVAKFGTKKDVDEAVDEVEDK